MNQIPEDRPSRGFVYLCERLEQYGFRCEAGSLKNCIEWKELRKMLGAYLH
jgi:hypothetical protein